jgi:hypothetical protein
MGATRESACAVPARTNAARDTARAKRSPLPTERKPSDPAKPMACRKFCSGGKIALDFHPRIIFIQLSQLIEGRPPEAVLKPEPGAASAGGLQPPAGAGAAAGQTPLAGPKPGREVPQVERREASVPIARDAETPRWLWRLDVPRKSTSGFPGRPKHPRVSRRSATPRSRQRSEVRGQIAPAHIGHLTSVLRPLTSVLRRP